MIKTNKDRLKIGILIIVIALILLFGVKSIIQYKQNDSSIKKGENWNSDLKKCETTYSIDTNRIDEYYWKTNYDTITNREYLKRGAMIDSISKSPKEFIEILNRRPTTCKIEYIEMTGDTLKIRILNEKYLTEQMGSTGAGCYMAETVFTLTENNKIQYVNFEMNYGSHASPGTYRRENYEQMLRK